MSEGKDLKSVMMIDLNIRPSGEPVEGVAIVNDEVLEHLLLKEEDKIMLYGKDMALLIGVAGDKSVRPSAISLHKEDIERLKARKNGKIGVKAFGTIVGKMDELIQRMHTKIEAYDQASDEKKSADT